MEEAVILNIFVITNLIRNKRNTTIALVFVVNVLFLFPDC